MSAHRYPSLYQINTRVWLTELSKTLKRPATLDDVPDSELDWLSGQGFDWVWFLGVWQTGPAGRQVSLNDPVWRREFQLLLPDFQDADVSGSCFSIRDYSVHTDFGGNAALERLRRRVHNHGLRLLLDFVPNHTAPDHLWVTEHPDFYVRGTEEQLEREPRNYVRIDTPRGPEVIAYGRDPYFPGWADTRQLNYANPKLQQAMTTQLANVASLCDGVRCDMAMLILPEVFERTWGLRPEPFWPTAIAHVRSLRPDFLFMAEVYWDLEWTLQQQGFDYTYDKRLYDRLRGQQARPVRDHFRADMDFQRKSARFLENHDEPRAEETFPPDVHRAAAVLTFLCPGLRFFHQGQFEGKRKRIPVHLRRGPDEPVDVQIREFYDRLLRIIHHPQLQDGDWQLLECTPAWEGNGTWDDVICFQWRRSGENTMIAVANYAPHQSQCYLHFPLDKAPDQTVRLRDQLGSAVYDRSAGDIKAHGLYLDLPAWGFNVFELTSPEVTEAVPERQPEMAARRR